MRKKHTIWSFRPNEKVRIYFKELGLVDGRTWQVRKDGPNMSEFINRCILQVCESQKNSRNSIAKPEELAVAYTEYKMVEAAKEWEQQGATHAEWKKRFHEAKELLVQRRNT